MGVRAGKDGGWWKNTVKGHCSLGPTECGQGGLALADLQIFKREASSLAIDGKSSNC